MSSSSIEPFKKFIVKRLLKYSNLNFIILLGITFFIGISAGYYYRVQNDIEKRGIEHELRTRAFEIVKNNETIGYVRDKSVIEKAIAEVQKELSERFGIEVIINKDLSLLNTHAEDNQILSVETLKTAIKSNLTYSVNGYAIKANGEILTVLRSKDEAEQILEEIKAPYIDRIESENSDLEDIEFLENVEIAKVTVPVSKVKDYDYALKWIMRGTDEEKIHVVEKGDTAWGIARKYGVTVEELEKANPDKNLKLIRPNDKISLIVPKPFITVITYEEKTYEDKVKYDVEYRTSSSLYKDQTRVKVKGKYGIKEVVAKIEKHNGIEVSREILSEKLIKKPKTQVVLKGTKPIPPILGSGLFRIPIKGRLTSPFGSRWGNKFHHGIDLAARTGTPIKAADGGIVTFAGWKYPYGYMVEIDHGGGFKTRYGHCSKLYVKKGDKVAPRETIAAVGNTGRSTGPHVHFEVRKYGVAYNPYNYINKKYR